jgi:hypothetical protein
MDEVQVLDVIVSDVKARRELLWLRAKEKGDEATARDLVRIDPGIVDRLSVAGFDVAERDGEPRRARAERFGRLQDVCYAHHAALVRKAGTVRRREDPPPPRRRW